MPIPMTKEGRRRIWKRCAQIEKDGGDVLEYLKSEGYISLRGAWFNLQDEFSGRKRSQFTDGKSGRSRTMGKKLTLEDKKNAVKVALGGGDPEEYLRSQGIKDTRQAWYRIRTDLKDADPETWEKLEATKKDGRRKKEPEEEKEPEPVEAPAPVQEPKNDNPPQIVKFKGKHGEVQKVKLYGENEEKGTEKVVHANPMDDSLSEIIEKFQKSPEKKKLFEEMKKRFEVPQEPIAIPKEPEEGLSLKITMLKGERNLYEFDRGNLLVKKIGFVDRLNLGTIEETEQFMKELKEAIKRFTA